MEPQTYRSGHYTKRFVSKDLARFHHDKITQLAKKKNIPTDDLQEDLQKELHYQLL